MNIRITIYKQILCFCPYVPPEVGGIIGASRDIIDSVAFDPGTQLNEAAVYSPNVKRLNEYIAQWQKNGIEFKGMFHSHPEGQESLSTDDIKYIKSIMLSMPKHVKELFFPIIIPNSHIISYKVINQNHSFNILHDRIDLVP